MLGMRQDILKSLTFAPRAHLEGVDIPASFQLPQLDDVAGDIATLQEIQRAGGPGHFNAVFTTGGVAQGAEDEMIEPLRYNLLLPHLFKFAYFAHMADVPETMLEPVVFALEQFIRVLTECPERQLRVIGHVLPHQTLETAQYFMLANARNKLAVHLMTRKINRPADAAKHLKKQAEADIPRLKSKEKPWTKNPNLYNLLSEALYLSGQYAESKPICERLLQDADKSHVSDLRTPIFMSHLMLSYALLRLGVEPEKQKEHTDWTVRVMKKAPNRFPAVVIGKYLDIQDGPMHPVLAAVGGERWLGKTKNTTTLRQDERMTRNCRTCDVSDMQKTLSRCARCQYTFYCSPQCQKSNWKAHKEQCTDIKNSRARVERLRQEGSPHAQKEADWVEWRNASHYASTHALQHALHLHRDPARGRTHIVVRQIEHAPDEPDFRHRFAFTHVGVFRLADCWDAIDELMGGPGEGRAMVDDILGDVDSTRGARGHDYTSMLDLTFGDGVQPWLGSMSTTLTALRRRPYEAEWRKLMNRKGVPPPEGILKFGNAEDSEFKFD
ncbi:zinc finger MYND domain-containing protein [Phanerochaete sordida]|uniref:Zinc finger MYND domain-containing protein n=1 Tax=Phanerochaete sordida TaxID=48140 RepID=A0A9P3GI91_9APHY|nr:zinc finger MYND domain-containing protein [Phanerochaete sordida]